LSKAKTHKSSNSYVSQAVSLKGSWPVKIPGCLLSQVSGRDPFLSPGEGHNPRCVDLPILGDTLQARVPVKLGVGLPVHIAVVMSEVMRFMFTYDNLNLHLTGKVD